MTQTSDCLSFNRLIVNEVLGWLEEKGEPATQEILIHVRKRVWRDVLRDQEAGTSPAD